MEAKVIETNEIVDVRYWYQSSSTNEYIYIEEPGYINSRSWAENELNFI